MKVPYYSVTLRCPHHRGQAGIFHMAMMNGNMDRAQALMQFMNCYGCRRMGTMQVVGVAKEPSYYVNVG